MQSIFGIFAEIIVAWVQDLGWIGVLAGILVESVIAPIPSPLIPMAAGAILIPDGLNVFEAAIQIGIIVGFVGAIGITIGAILMYGIGFYGGRPFIQKFQRWIGVSWEEVDAFGNKLETNQRTGIFLFLTRAIPIIPLSLISLAGGSIRIKSRTFFVWTFLGGLPRCFVLGFLGWILREQFGGLSNILDNVETLILIGSVLIIILYFVIKRIRDTQMNKYLYSKPLPVSES